MPNIDLKEIAGYKIIIFVVTFIASVVGLYVRFSQKVYAVDVSGEINADTTWTTADSPYNITGDIYIRSGATLTIDPGVQVQSDGNYSLVVENGSLSAIGSSGSEIVFSSTSGTSAGSWEGIIVQSTGTATLDYADVSYADQGLLVRGGSATVTNSTFSTNSIGVSAHTDATLTLNDNIFISNELVPLSINPDVAEANLSYSGNTLGTGSDLNGYNAIGFGYEQASVSDCPSNLCEMPQRNFGGITNIPYMYLPTSLYTLTGADDTLTINSGVVVKFRDQNGSQGLELQNGSHLVVSGTSGNEVVFTTEYDDNYGGDTNNDGTATSMADGIWEGVWIESGSAATIDYAKFYGSDAAVIIHGSGSNAIVRDNLLEENNVGIVVYDNAELTTENNVFNKQEFMPLSINPDVDDSNINLGTSVSGTADVLGSGSDANGYNAIGIGYKDANTGACPNDQCEIPQREFAGIDNIPYLGFLAYTLNASSDTLTIDGGVIIKHRSHFTNQGFRLENGSDLEVNGSSGTEVIFTTEYDDNYGGDTNNDGAATSMSDGIWEGIWVRNNGTGTVDYAKIYGSDPGVMIYGSGASGIVRDSLFEGNKVGIVVYDNAGLTTENNSFNKQEYTPVSINPDVDDANISLGTSGAGTADVLGSGSDANGYNAIGIGYKDANTGACPNDQCEIPQREFAGINNVPYFNFSEYLLIGSNDTLTINSGVIIKHRDYFGSQGFKARNGSDIIVSGVSGNEVIFTTEYDDNYGGDTNNDGTVTSMNDGMWEGIRIESNSDLTVDYAKIYGSDPGVMIYGSGANGIVRDSLFEGNKVGIVVYDNAGLTTENNSFNKQEYTPVSINPDVDDANISLGTSGAGTADVLGSGSDANGYNAIGIGYKDNDTDNCPSDQCIILQRDFAGISDIPYLNLNMYRLFGNGDTLIMNPGVIIKNKQEVSDIGFRITNNANLDVNGALDSEVIMTSEYDDSHGGDTNNDGVATTPSFDNWNSIEINGGNTANIEFMKMFYGDRGLEVLNANDVQMVDSYLVENDYGMYVQDPASVTNLARLNIKDNNSYGIYNDTATTLMAENLYWGSVDGPLDTSNDGACTSNSGGGDVVSDDSTHVVDYCPFAVQAFNENDDPSANIVAGADNIYPGVQLDIEVEYSDGNGASELDRLYLQIQNATGGDIEYYAVEGADGTGLNPTVVQGDSYVSSIFYDRDFQSTDSNTITVIWHVTIGWNWAEDIDVEYGVRATDDQGGDSGYGYTNADYLYENDLDLTGTLSVTGNIQGVLSSGGWVQGSESIVWSGQKVVFEGTTDVYPQDSDFDVQITDDDGSTFVDLLSSGGNFSITSTADPGTDIEDIHNIDIVNIPSGGSDVTNSQFTLRVDGDSPYDESVVIDGGAATTQDLEVELAISATEDQTSVVEMRMGESSDLTGESWVAYSSPTNFTLSSGNGEKTVYVQVRDSVGNPSTTFSDTIILDNQGPVGSITINSGDAYATSQNVILSIAGTDDTGTVEDMRYSEDNTFSGGSQPWEPYDFNASYTLSSGDEEKTIYLQLRDDAGNVSIIYSDSIILDTSPPSLNSFIINSGSSYTNSSNVNLSLNATDAVEMQLSEESDFSDIPIWDWQVFSSTTTFSLSVGDGSKVVYARVRDSAGNISNVLDDSIILDTELPTGSILINDGDTYTNTQLVDLDLTGFDATSSVEDMKISEDPAFDGVSWTAFSTEVADFMLSSSDGVKTVYAQFRDSARNESIVYSDDIELDASEPGGGDLTINSGDTHTQDPVLNLEITINDPGSGIADMRIGETADLTGITWESFSATTTYDVGTVNGLKTVYVQVRDIAGNESDPFSDDITFDNESPTGSMVIENDNTYAVVPTVTLNLTVSDTTSELEFMRISEDPTFNSGTQVWVTYAVDPSFEMSEGDGSKTVYIEIMDEAGNTETFSDEVILDSISPTGGLTIDGGAEYTNDLEVEITVSGSDSLSGMSEMRLSEDNGFDDGNEPWIAFSTEPFTFTLSSGDEVKNVYLQLKDVAGNFSSIYTSEIELDTNGPEDGELLINGGEMYTRSQTVNLEISAVDGGAPIVEMMLSEDVNFTSGVWEPYLLETDFSLSVENGIKTIFGKVRDEVGNESAIFHDSIVFDNVGPVGGMVLNSYNYDGTGSVLGVTINASDLISPVTDYRISHRSDLISGTGWEDFEQNKSLSYSYPGNFEGESLYIQFNDAAGNPSDIYSLNLEDDSPTTSGSDEEDVLAETGLSIGWYLSVVLFFGAMFLFNVSCFGLYKRILRVSDGGCL